MELKLAGDHFVEPIKYLKKAVRSAEKKKNLTLFILISMFGSENSWTHP